MSNWKNDHCRISDTNKAQVLSFMSITHHILRMMNFTNHLDYQSSNIRERYK